MTPAMSFDARRTQIPIDGVRGCTVLSMGSTAPWLRTIFSHNPDVLGRPRDHGQRAGREVPHAEESQRKDKGRPECKE